MRFLKNLKDKFSDKMSVRIHPEYKKKNHDEEEHNNIVNSHYDGMRGYLRPR